MYNRYYGNSGRVETIREGPKAPPPRKPNPPPPPPPQAHAPLMRRQPPRPGLFESLNRMLPGTREPLETEDVILLLILYLMYRESGDTELLMIMGGLFLF